MSGFDVHDCRHALKQLRDTGETSLWKNRKGVSCPVCDEPFDRLFITQKPSTEFPENDGSRFCLLHDGSEIQIFRH